MTFCTKCGKQLNDGAKFCTSCGNVISDAQPTAQPAAQPQATQTDSPYAVNSTTPIGQGTASKAFKNLPIILTTFWKNSDSTLKIAKDNKDLAVSGIFSGIFFVMVFLGYMFSVLGCKLKMGFDFPKVLLTSFVLTVTIAAFYIIIMFLGEMLFAKSKNPVKSIIDSFISFSINSMPASIGFLLFGLASFIYADMAWFIMALTAGYLIVSLLVNLKNMVPAGVDSLKFILLATVLVAVAGYFTTVIFSSMNNWTLQGSLGSAYSSIMDTYNSYSDLFSGLY